MAAAKDRGVSFAEGEKKAPMIPKGPGTGWKIPSYYEVKQLVGTGSYGTVCEAFDQKGKRLVAIKRMKGLFEDLVDCKRILREIAILSRLSHRSVVQLIEIPMPPEVGSFDEIYMVMEICDSDLKKLMRTDVTLSDLHINTLLHNLLVGLKYVHSAGIYHRDLKPANVLVNQDCSVRICDFGLSRAIGGEQPYLDALPNTPREHTDAEGRRTSGVVVAPTQRMKRHLTGHVVTRWYRAPELILLQEDYNQAIDLWSVGCIYAELLGMLEGTNTRDRGPLFPGSSCFPLSPDHKHKTDYKYHTKGKHDQLNMIFNLLGTPDASVMEDLVREDAKRYIKCFASREGEGIRKKYPRASAQSVALLEKLLKFDPKVRATVDDALTDPLLRDLRDPSREVVAPSLITLSFETEADLTEEMLRRCFKQEIENMTTR